MADAHVNPVMLRWALARSSVNRSDLATSLKKAESTIEQWLTGEAAPTFRQAQKLAKQLRVPFGYLFLEEPPEENVPLPDFRRHPASIDLSLDLRDVISDVLRKQDWYRDHRAERDEEPIEFVGRFTISSDASVVAEDIRATLEFETHIRQESQADSFLRAFVNQVEAAGVLVMRNGIVGHATNRALRVEEFRGFSIADPMAPVIFLNNADSNAAQAFTLAHELAHIWIGQGGISDADVTISGEGPGDVEAFCNEVAGELLLPWAALSERWRQRSTAFDDWSSQIAREFHVSTVMVARQLWQHEAIGREQFFDFYGREKQNWTSKQAAGSGGNYYLTAPIRNSRRLTQSVLESVEASETSIREASRLLGVKPANLPKLEEYMGVG
jgi:Zn-dependent peptidase ImmA (M78 family)/DNA-binding XRE family transcriptional regulator